MNGAPTQMPLKVCPSCSVATRTNADACPSCGARYGRRRLQERLRLRWSWWFGIPIVAAAFAIGYFGLSNLIEADSEGDGAGITLEQGAAVPDRVSRSALESHLGGESPVLVQQRRGEKRVKCAYFAITDQPGSVWEFCFERDELLSSAPIGESALESDAVPAPGALRGG